MERFSLSPGQEDRHANPGCAYIVDDDEGRRFCGEALRPDSSYCRQHHALCHVACGTTEEVRRLREVEALARVVGGRRASEASGPSRRFLRRLEQAVQTFL
jgi:hypothetical protein